MTAEIVMIAGVIGKVIAKPAKSLLSYISKPFIAVYNYNKNVESLKKKAEELKVKLQTVEDYENYVERRGEVIDNDLQTWLANTKQLMNEAGKVFADDEENAKKNCFSRRCLNPMSRYKLSKKAAQNSDSIAQQLSKASEFSLPHAYAPAPVVEVASAERFPGLPLKKRGFGADHGGVAKYKGEQDWPSWDARCWEVDAG